MGVWIESVWGTGMSDKECIPARDGRFRDGVVWGATG